MSQRFYKIVMMSGEVYRVNQSEYQKIISGTGGVFVPRLEAYINSASISTAYPEDRADAIEERRTQKTGFLHDGTRVVQEFGEWVIAGDRVPDDRGQYQRIKPDALYYPEVAADAVATEAEWQRVQAGEEYYAVVGYNPQNNRLLNRQSGLTHITEKSND